MVTHLKREWILCFTARPMPFQGPAKLLLLKLLTPLMGHRLNIFSSQHSALIVTSNKHPTVFLLVPEQSLLRKSSEVSKKLKIGMTSFNQKLDFPVEINYTEEIDA